MILGCSHAGAKRGSDRKGKASIRQLLCLQYEGMPSCFVGSCYRSIIPCAIVPLCHRCLVLQVIYNPNKTGFEESAEYPMKTNQVAYSGLHPIWGAGTRCILGCLACDARHEADVMWHYETPHLCRVVGHCRQISNLGLHRKCCILACCTGATPCVLLPSTWLPCEGLCHTRQLLIKKCHAPSMQLLTAQVPTQEHAIGLLALFIPSGMAN